MINMNASCRPSLCDRDMLFIFKPVMSSSRPFTMTPIFYGPFLSPGSPNTLENERMYINGRFFRTFTGAAILGTQLWEAGYVATFEIRLIIEPLALSFSEEIDNGNLGWLVAVSDGNGGLANAGVRRV